jgi:predicted 2-oxoglutarate/Fe(II)-dependent dioxygenase YbiX
MDEKDYGLSYLVPWGEYEGGDLVLVQLGIKVELRPGDAIFFRSAHIVRMIGKPKRDRGIVTLFSHANTFTYIDKMRKKN